MKPRAYEGNEDYIFISYAHRDQEQVFQVLRALEEQGYRLWYDDGIAPGSEWPEDIAQHLNGSAMVIAFITPRSVSSVNCRREIHFALSKEKPFLAVVLEPTDLPLGLELQLGSQRSVMRSAYPEWKAFLEKILACPGLAPCLGERRAAPAPEPVLAASFETDKEAFSRAYLQYFGRDGYTVDYPAAFRETKRLAEKGHPPAMALLGVIYLEGKAAQTDPVQARYWLERGAEADDSWAQLVLGWQLLDRDGEFQTNVWLGLFWLEKAADKGEERACESLGTAYSTDQRIPLDGKKAIYWFEKGAELGDQTCQCCAGEMYMRGELIEKNPSLAVKWMRRAAEAGSSYGQFFMGEFRRCGFGVEQDREEALRWYALAAKQGDTDASERLRMMQANTERA